MNLQFAAPRTSGASAVSQNRLPVGEGGPVDTSSPDIRKWTAYGYKWIDSEEGVHFYQKTLDASRSRYAAMRLLDSDMTPKNFELMCRMNLTNTNPAPRKPRAARVEGN